MAPAIQWLLMGGCSGFSSHLQLGPSSVGSTSLGVGALPDVLNLDSLCGTSHPRMKSKWMQHQLGPQFLTHPLLRSSVPPFLKNNKHNTGILSEGWLAGTQGTIFIMLWAAVRH